MVTKGSGALTKVSVHIITYNQKDFIGEAIDSALAQDYPDLEVVVADDASTDGTADIVADYARRYPDNVVALLNPSNVGITANSNVGLWACSGDLIAFMGGDDVLLPGKISAQVAWFAGRPRRVLCGHQVEVFYEDRSRPPHPLVRCLRSGTGAAMLVRHLPFGATSVMVRADRVPAHGFDEQLPVVSDQLMWVEIVREDGEYGYVDGTLARYRRHDANVTNNPLDNIRDIDRYLQIVGERFPSFAPAVRFAVTRRLHYGVGVALLNVGRKAEARREFAAAIRREPLFVKAWARALQTFL